MPPPPSPFYICTPGLRPTSFFDWKRIDQVEQLQGKPKGKPREKVTSLEVMMDIIRTRN